MQVWIVDTGLPGATNQCMGIARAIATIAPCEITRVRTRIRTKLVRPLVSFALERRWIGAGHQTFIPRAFTHLLFSGIRATSELPDVIVTTLGRSEYTAALHGGDNGAFAIHIGAPLNVPVSTFDFIALVNDETLEEDTVPHVHLPIYPTPVLRREIEAMAAQSDMVSKGDRRRWSLLVGGDGAGYTFNPLDWASLASGITQLARHFGAKLLVTTSPRTSNAAERHISALLPSDVVERAVWYASDPQPVIGTFMSASDIVFCTADSRSMMADAIVAGRPVYAVGPQQVATNAAHARFLDIQESAHRLRRVEFSEIASINVDADCHTWFRPLESCWSSKFLDALLATDFCRRFAATGSPQSQPQTVVEI